MTDNKPANGSKPKQISRAEVEAAMAAQVSGWLRIHALNSAAGAVTAEAHSTAVNAASAATMLRIANAIDNGEWRPDWRPPVEAS